MALAAERAAIASLADVLEPSERRIRIDYGPFAIVRGRYASNEGSGLPRSCRAMLHERPFPPRV